MGTKIHKLKGKHYGRVVKYIITSLRNDFMTPNKRVYIFFISIFFLIVKRRFTGLLTDNKAQPLVMVRFY